MFMRKGDPIVPNIKTRQRIEMISDKIVRVTPRRLSASQREAVFEALEEMIQLRVVRKSKSPWAAQTAMVPKPDGKWRCCIDFRGLNSVTKRNAHPIPRTNDVIDTLASATYFTAIDMYKGYWQVPMEESDIEKTAFITPLGLY